jgi:hypothetical protein
MDSKFVEWLCRRIGFPARGLAMLLLSLSSICARGQPTLNNGANQAGTIYTNTTDSYVFTANKGDNFVLRLGTTGFYGELSLYGPTGPLLAIAYSGYDAELAFVATNSGTFTVIVSSYSAGGSGTYVLHLAQCPEAFSVPGGDEGGPMTNGGNHAGAITLGDLDMWSLTANAGDNIVLRLGTAGFYGMLRLYGPNGALLKTAYSGYDAELAYTPTNTGTFTALVSAYSSGGTGSYVLYLAQFPEAFIVPAGDEGGPMTNGGNYSGTNSLGDLDIYSFNANPGDNFVLRLGTVGYYGILRLYGPNGALLKTAYSGYDAELAWTATNSGTFAVLVSSYSSGDSGTYVLHLAQFPEPFIVPAGDEGGLMANAGNYSGTNSLGDLDIYSFSANTGDNIVLRLGTVGYYGILRLYGPNGALLRTAYSGYDAELAWTATNSGTFAALVSSYNGGEAGTYVLHFAQFPEPFTVPAGDEGGPLSNGGNHAGSIALGDLDLWSLSANAGDNIVLRLGTVGFDGNLRLYGPNGALLKTAYSGTDATLAWTATNSGIFTALVSSYASGTTGSYVLYLAQFPGSFIVPGGDEGGPMNGSGNYSGTIALGDLDIWAFTACTGDFLNLVVYSTNFYGNLSLYGPNGALLKTAASGTTATLNYATTNSGRFMLLVDSYYAGGTGTYLLSANGLADSMRLCRPAITGTNGNLSGVGGRPGVTFTLFTQTNVALPFALWTPLRTNQFDAFGAFSYPHLFNPAEPQRFFRVAVP